MIKENGIIKLTVEETLDIAKDVLVYIEILKAIKKTAAYETIKGEQSFTGEKSGNRFKILVEIDKDDVVTISGDHPIYEFITDVYYGKIAETILTNI